MGGGRLVADGRGVIELPPFPDGAGVAATDWAAKLVCDG
jgi:hypothetical protein